MSSTAVAMPHQLAFELSLLNAVTSATRAIAAFWANEGLTVSSGWKTESSSDESFWQGVYFVKDVQRNPQPFFFLGNPFCVEIFEVATEKISRN